MRSKFNYFLLATGVWAIGASSSIAAEPFYRIIDGARPSARQMKIDRYRYGAQILYTGDAPNGPVHVRGTVWHSNLSEARFFMGDHNPVVDQKELLSRIENNKWEEAKLMMASVPDAFPKTENMADILAAEGLTDSLKGSPLHLRKLSGLLRERYPQGFFLKPIAGFNSAGTFPTEKTDFAVDYQNYLSNVKPKLERFLKKTGDPVGAHLELKGLENYSGRVLDYLTTRPEIVIIQEKLEPVFGSDHRAIEYRVHVMEGQVLSGGTQNRWEDGRFISAEEISRVEEFTQATINRLPKKMRKMCFALDVLKTQNGTFKIIELNAGGESGYLYPDTDIWVTQLLAAHYRGEATPLLKAFEKIRSARTLESQERGLSELLKRQELRGLEPASEVLSEVLAQAKDVFLKTLGQSPPPAQVLKMRELVQKFSLEPLLTTGDIELLGQELTKVYGNSDSPKILADLRKDLSLGSGELLYYDGRGKLRLSNGVHYDDGFVQEALSESIAGSMKNTTHPKLKQEVVRALIEEKIVTRAEIIKNPSLTNRLVKGGDTLFYTGRKEALVRLVLQSLRKP